MAQTVKRLPTTWETQVQSLGREDPLEKEMATHSSSLAWKIPWTEEPGRLQSMGSQRVGHDWATSLSLSLSLIYLGASQVAQWWSACQYRRCRRHNFDPWVGKIPWCRKHSNSLQYSCLENPMDRGAWQATYSSWGCKESDTIKHTHKVEKIYFSR